MSNIDVTNILSKEAIIVFNDLKSQLLNVGHMNDELANINAIIFAMHADVVANMSDNGYTALNYYKDKFELNTTKQMINGFQQFAGENSLTYNRVSLIEAKKMYEKGNSDEDIWSKTGWKKGSDNKWRYEIPDDIENISLKKLVEGVYSQKNIKLSDIYTNTTLYKAYPSLKDIEVSVKDSDFTQYGFYNKRSLDFGKTWDNYISLNKNKVLCTQLDFIDGEKARKEVKSTTIHEIQHIIQDIECFAKGGSLATKNTLSSQLKAQYNKIPKDTIDKYKNLYAKTDDMDDLDAWSKAMIEFDNFYDEHEHEINIMTKWEKVSKSSDYEVYKNLGGEQEARETASRAMTSRDDMPVIHDNNAIIYFGNNVVASFNEDTLIKGNITILDNDKRIVSLYEKADGSTFIHEMGHMFLMDLEELSKFDEASKSDLRTINDWAKWDKNKGYREYLGTPWEQEFKYRHEAILQARKNQDYNKLIKLKEEWKQEKFSRGFELYINDKKAPTKEIQNVFDKFKTYVKDLYYGFKCIGCKPNKDVERIMNKLTFGKSFNQDNTLSNFIANKINQKKSVRAIIEQTLKNKNNFNELKGLSLAKQRKLITDMVKTQSKIIVH